MFYPQKVILTEVGPRDGLQNEKEIIATEDKISFIEALAEAGFTRIEITSFVSPKWIPQMADAAQIYRKVSKKIGVKYIALVPNEKGLQQALANGVDAIAVFTAASETFNKKNINQTIEESLQQISSIVSKAKSQQIWVRGYISTCFACPYQGPISPASVLDISKHLLGCGVDELSIGDTIGVATPVQVEKLMNLLLQACSPEQIALHFHDTRGTALANVLIGLQMGILKFDCSAGGLGGCPYAPGASGNLASEDLIYMLQEMGIDTGIDLERLMQASQKISARLGKNLPSKYLQAHLSRCSS